CDALSTRERRQVRRYGQAPSWYRKCEGLAHTARRRHENYPSGQGTGGGELHVAGSCSGRYCERGWYRKRGIGRLQFGNRWRGCGRAQRDDATPGNPGCQDGGYAGQRQRLGECRRYERNGGGESCCAQSGRNGGALRSCNRGGRRCEGGGNGARRDSESPRNGQQRREAARKGNCNTTDRRSLGKSDRAGGARGGGQTGCGTLKGGERYRSHQGERGWFGRAVQHSADSGGLICGESVCCSEKCYTARARGNREEHTSELQSLTNLVCRL